MNPHTLSRERLFYVDWLRIGAFALLVLYHVGMVYVPWDFHVKHQPTYAALEPLMRLSNPWRMGLLFVISGLATGLMLGRAGLARERSKRLLLPLLFGMAVIVPPQAWLQVREQFGYAGAYLDFLRLYFSAYGGFCNGKQCLALPTWNHLWFLPYLWCYTMLLLLALRRCRSRRCCARPTALARLSGWRLLVLPVLLLGCARALLFPRFGETHALLDDWSAHAAYAPLFGFGVLLARRRVLLQRLQDSALAGAGAGPGGLDGAGRLPRHGGRLAGGARSRSACRCVRPSPRRSGVASSPPSALRAAHLDVDHRWRAPLTEAVFPLYLVHQTILIVAAVALRPLSLPAGGEAAVIVALTFAGGWMPGGWHDAAAGCGPGWACRRRGRPRSPLSGRRP